MAQPYDPDADPWDIREQAFPTSRSLRARLIFLLRYAILAPSTRNSQPWRFAVDDAEIRIVADPSRWQRVADPEQRELFISLGCALENLLIAAEHFGYRCEVCYTPDSTWPEFAASVTFWPGEAALPRWPPQLFGAILKRFSHHAGFEPRTISPEGAAFIQGFCTDPGLCLHLTGDAAARRAADALVARADARGFADPAYREELADCIGRGWLGMPWLFSIIARVAVAHLDLGRSIVKKDHELLMTAPLLGLLCSEKDGRREQLRTGQVFERVYLAAATLGMGVHPVSQLVQFPEIKAKLIQLMPVPRWVPQQPFCLGYAAPPRHRTPRRPLAEVVD